MTNEPGSGRAYEAEDAALAQAGAAQSLSEQEAAPEAEVQPDDRQRMLDEREERFARRRKAMGPTTDQIPETAPEEAPPVSGEQPSTTPESNEP